MSDIIHRGDAYVLRTCAADMTSYGGFVWPREGVVEAPDWQPTADCGRGLHGFLWGEGDGSLADWSRDAVWIVSRINEWIDLDGKVKFPRAEVVFSGSREDATAKIRELGANGAVIGSTLTGGHGSILTGGRGSTLTGGDRSTLTGGDYSTLTGGRGSTLTGGDYSTLTGGRGSTLTGGRGSTLTGGRGSTLTGGDYSTLTGGHGSTLTGGRGSILTGGDGSILCLSWRDGNRHRIVVAYVGEDGVKADTAYRLRDGKLVEVPQ